MLKTAIQLINTFNQYFSIFVVHATHKINVTQNLNFVFRKGISTNIVGKRRKNAGYQHLLLFPKYFQRAFSSRVIKSWYRVKNSNFKFLRVKGRKLIYLTSHFLIEKYITFSDRKKVTFRLYKLASLKKRPREVSFTIFK